MNFIDKIKEAFSPNYKERQIVREAKRLYQDLKDSRNELISLMDSDPRGRDTEYTDHSDRLDRLHDEAEDIRQDILDDIKQIQRSIDCYRAADVTSNFSSHHVEHQKENLAALIEVIEKSQRTRSLYMPIWLSDDQGNEKEMLSILKTEGLHACGNRACLGGHLRLMSNLKMNDAAFVEENPSCAGVIRGTFVSAHLMFQYVTGVPAWFASLLMYPDESYANNGDDHIFSSTPHSLYGVDFSEVTEDHVLPILRRLYDGEDPHAIRLEMYEKYKPQPFDPDAEL